MLKKDLDKYFNLIKENQVESIFINIEYLKDSINNSNNVLLEGRDYYPDETFPELVKYPLFEKRDYMGVIGDYLLVLKGEVIALTSKTWTEGQEYVYFVSKEANKEFDKYIQERLIHYHNMEYEGNETSYLSDINEDYIKQYKDKFDNEYYKLDNPTEILYKQRGYDINNPNIYYTFPKVSYVPHEHVIVNVHDVKTDEMIENDKRLNMSDIHFKNYLF